MRHRLSGIVASLAMAGIEFTDAIDMLLVAGRPNAGEEPSGGVVIDWLSQTGPNIRPLRFGMQRRIFTGSRRTARGTAGDHSLGGGGCPRRFPKRCV